MLGYDSFNLIENLGLISFLLVANIAWIVITVMIATMWAFIGLSCNRNSWLPKQLSITYMMQGQLRFMIEIFFELLISSTLFIGMFRTKSIWNEIDEILVRVQIILLIICAFFALYIVWFTAIKIRPLVKKK